MHQLSLVAFCLLCVAATSFADEECSVVVEDIAVVQDFDFTRFLGNWYEYKWTNTDVADEDVQLHVRTHQDEDKMLFKYFYRDEEFISNHPHGCGTNLNEVTLSGDGDGNWVTNSTWDGRPVDVNMKLLGTDYENYAVLYICENVTDTGVCIPGQMLDVNIWTREQETISGDDLATVTQLLSDVCVDIDDMGSTTYTANDECSPKCTVADVRSQAMKDVDVKKFLGLWQDHLWSRTDFPLSSVMCNFRNTKADQQLVMDCSISQVENATAEDCNALRFEVAMADPTVGDWTRNTTDLNNVAVDTEDKPFVLLDTDYETYAITYTCAIIDENGMCGEPPRSSVWHRPRASSDTSPPISEETMNHIRNVLASVCLDVDTYITTLKTDVCLPTQQCLVHNIRDRAMANVDFYDYSGLWHVELWSRPDILGTDYACNYRCVEGSYLMDCAYGPLNPDTNSMCYHNTYAITQADGDFGDWTINTTFHSEPHTPPYVLLDTDYTSYAVMYGCKDIRNDGMCNEVPRVNVWYRNTANEDLTHDTLLHVGRLLQSICLDIVEDFVTEPTGSDCTPHMPQQSHTEEDCEPPVTQQPESGSGHITVMTSLMYLMVTMVMAAITTM